MKAAKSPDRILQNIPVPPAQWQSVVASVELPGQQLSIVELVMRNYCDKQIAAELGLKVPTVRTYLRRVFDKMGVNGRVELVLLICALSHGMPPHQ